MEYFRPTYYKKFKCIASKCKHTCCAMWELEVDEDAFDLYSMHYAKIAKTVETKNGEHCFKTDKNGRCVNLRPDGLCDIICKYGEDRIPYNCEQHPRFYNEFDFRVELGLGIACEEAARIILDTKEPFELEIYKKDSGHLYYDESSDISDAAKAAIAEGQRELISKEELAISSFQNSDNVLQTATMLAQKHLVPDSVFNPFVQYNILKACERLDKKWDIYLDKMPGVKDFDVSDFEYIFKNLAIYFAYRQSSLLNESETAYFAYIAFSLSSIINLAKANKVTDKRILLDICRAYSAEIEYSTDNIYNILMGL